MFLAIWSAVPYLLRMTWDARNGDINRTSFAFSIIYKITWIISSLVVWWAFLLRMEGCEDGDFDIDGETFNLVLFAVAVVFVVVCILLCFYYNAIDLDSASKGDRERVRTRVKTGLILMLNRLCYMDVPRKYLFTTILVKRYSRTSCMACLYGLRFLWNYYLYCVYIC
eukprot:UN24095